MEDLRSGGSGCVCIMLNTSIWGFLAVLGGDNLILAIFFAFTSSNLSIACSTLSCISDRSFPELLAKQVRASFKSCLVIPRTSAKDCSSCCFLCPDLQIALGRLLLRLCLKNNVVLVLL